jgi:heat shock protein HslJ
MKKNHMRKLSFILPLAVFFASCRTTERTATTNMGSGTTGSVSTSGMSSSTASNTNTSSSRFKGYDLNTYNPNNYMQNPDKYKTPNELAKTGGWTYNTQWNHNTNFLSEALGEWMLSPTPEVAAFWIPDSSRADSYAAYWTPEAVAARQQQKMMAEAAYRDSLAKAQGWSQATASRGKGKIGGMKGSATLGSGSTGSMSAAGISGTATPTGSNNMNTNTTGSTTGTTSSSSDMTTTGTTTGSTDMTTAGTTAPSTVDNTKNYLMAVNGNMFQLPKLNLYLQNGTFTGYTGSNQLVGTLKVNGTQIHFDETVPSTNISLPGGFSQAAFMERLARVDSYDVTDGQLRLKQGNEVLFVLAKNAVH